MIKKEKKLKTGREREELEENIKFTIEKQNKLLRNIFIIIILFLAIFLISFYVIESRKSFTYENIDFEIVDELAPYMTSIPVYFTDKMTGQTIQKDYLFFLRKDPRITGKNVNFDGDLNIFELVVFNSSQPFNCDGDGIIATANLVNLLGKVGAEVIKNENITCDDTQQYTFIRLLEGEETKIIQTGESCYDFIINQCEILEVTERFMLEIFGEVNQRLETS